MIVLNLMELVKMAEKKEERKADRVVVESEERAFEEGRLERGGFGPEPNMVSEMDRERQRESGPIGESAKKSARRQGT